MSIVQKKTATGKQMSRKDNATPGYSVKFAMFIDFVKENAMKGRNKNSHAIVGQGLLIEPSQ